MKHIFFSFFLVTFFSISVSAQDKPKDAYHPAYGEPSTSTKVKKNKEVQEKQKDYFKKAKKEGGKKKDCDCPGNPKNKMNKNNPYKRKRGY